MKNKLYAIVGLAAVLGFTGCATVPIDPTTSKRESVIPILFTVKNVRLSLNLATAENIVKQTGFTFNVQTGKIYRQIFTGGENAPYVLDLVNANLGQQASDVMLLATSTRVTYTVSVVLTSPDGTKQIFNASGTASTAWTIDRAIREAIELAVVDLAKQIKVATAGP